MRLRDMRAEKSPETRVAEAARGLLLAGCVAVALVAGVVTFAAAEGWSMLGVARSAIRGAEGNVEFFLHLDLERSGLDDGDLERAIRNSVIPREHENDS